MFNATFYATVRNTHIRFKKGDTFPAMTVNVRLQSGDLCTVYSSNPIMMLFMMNSVTVDSDWLIQGEITQTKPFTEKLSGVHRIIYFCVPEALQELPSRKMIKSIENPLKRFSLKDDFPGKLEKLQKIILGFIVFEKYTSVESTSNVDLDERIEYFENKFDVDYKSIEEVEAAFYECFPTERPTKVVHAMEKSDSPSSEIPSR